MSKKQVSPVHPYAEITIGGVVYKMTLTNRALAVAEDELMRRGYDVQLLLSKMQRGKLSHSRVLFAASLMHYQPELDFDESQDLLDGYEAEFLLRLAETENKSFADAAKADPPTPADQEPGE